MLGLLGMAGISVDVGKAYAVRNQLQSAVNAAALAGSAYVYNNPTGTNSPTSIALQYLNQNNNTGLTAVSGYPQANAVCLNILMPSGQSCVTSGSNKTPANAVKVTAWVQVPTSIIAVMGIHNLNVGASATASMQGVAQLWNVAIILDTTGSMGSKDPYCAQANSTAEQCAMTGIQTLLKGINPCSSGQAGCTADSAGANFRVSMFVFPNVLQTQASDYYKCRTATAQIYTLPAIPASTSTSAYTPFAYTGSSGGTTLAAATYQILQHSDDTANIDANGFTSDYYAGTQTLNSTSILVKEIGDGSTNGCIKPPSTSGWPDSHYMTSFAGAIYAAQTALLAEQAYTATLGLTTQNAIIFVSDGQANMPYDGFPQKTSTADTGGDSVTSAGTNIYSATATNLTGTKGTWGQYPDFNAGCQQAIMAAQYAKSLGTRFYAVAYGSESNGCVTDDGTLGGSAQVVITTTPYVPASSITPNVPINVPITSATQVIPCIVMENMASQGATANDNWYFYTDGSSAANGCTDTSHTSTGLNSIFGAIQTTFTHPRLLPAHAS
jgi:Flp pilus assembly protein TadG